MASPSTPAQRARPPRLDRHAGPVQAWWHVLRFAAITLATALSPSAYDRVMRRAAARQIHLSAWQALPGFLVACAALSYVLSRIVIDTAHDYGLSGYAPELTIRLLVLEVIPLLAALSVALRSGAAISADVALMRIEGRFEALRVAGRDPVRHVLAPRAFGSVIAVVLLAWLSSAIAMVLVYLAMYGFSPWGVSQYLRITGQVFGPVEVAGLGLKTLFLGLAVASIPISAALAIPRGGRSVPMAVRSAMVRLGIALAAIELASLAIMYA